MNLAEEIKKIAEANLTSASQFVVDVIVTAKKGPKKILVFIDGDEGVNIDDCAQLNRALSKILDETALVEDESYLLEVSTHGLDQPLKLTRQYSKNIGRKLKIQLADKVVEGKLESVTNDFIVLLQEVGTGKKKETNNLEIHFSQIEKAFVLVSFK
jgi:ribosome maturation factor RimP